MLGLFTLAVTAESEWGTKALHEAVETTRVHIDLDATLTSFVGLDVDDDIAALFLAGTEGVEVTGLTATHGNGPMWSTCPGAKRLAEVMGLDAQEVACGTGYNTDFTLAGNPAAKVVGEAMDRGETILALGAMTNIAAAIYEKPSRGANAKVVAMGGILEAGGLELNFWVDHKAANYVIEVFAGDVVAVTRETCLTMGVMTHDDLDDMDSCLPETSFVKGWLPRIRRHIEESTYRRAAYFGSEVASEIGDGFVPWDVITAAAVSDPELFNGGFECRLACDGDFCDRDANSVPIGPVVKLQEGERCRRPASPGQPARLLVPPTVNGKEMRRTIVERVCAAQAESSGYSAPIDAIYEQFDKLRMVPLPRGAHWLATGIPLWGLVIFAKWAPVILKSVVAVVLGLVWLVFDSKRQAAESTSLPSMVRVRSSNRLVLLPTDSL